MSRSEADAFSQVTVVVPCYNDGQFLHENMESLQEQTFKNFEVKIVNDGSTDPKTLEILTNLQESFPSLVLSIYSQNNQGLSAARNRGVREAHTEWVMLLDADDKLAPKYLERTLALAKTEGLDYVTTDIKHFGIYNYITRSNINLYDQLFSNRLTPSSLFRKIVLEAVPFDPEFREGYEDWEFWIRLQSIGYKGGVVHEPLFEYRRKSESMLTSTYYKRSELIRKIRKKHEDLYTLNKLAEIKRNWRHNRQVPVWLYQSQYLVGLRFPRFAHFMTLPRQYYLRYFSG
jgi:glycosyltransferase involved in cell wall biosynthesis